MALDLSTAPPRVVGGTCTVGAWLRDNPADAPALRAALDNPAWSARALSLRLRDQGIILGEQTLNRHRAGGCKCADRGLV